MTRQSPKDSRAVMAARHEPMDSADFAPTPPYGGRALLEILRRIDPLVAAGEASAEEPACGAGHLAHGLRDGFPDLIVSDKFDYGWGHEIRDYLAEDGARRAPVDWVITNPPFGRLVEPFIRAAWARARRGVAVLLQLRALEGLNRHRLFAEIPLYATCPFAERLAIHMGGWAPAGNTATAYAWFVMIKPPVLEAGAPPPAFEGHRITIPPGTQRRLSRLSDARFARRGPDGRVSLRDLQALGGDLPAGMMLTEQGLATLEDLARQGPGGTCALPMGNLTGGRLSGLVQAELGARLDGDELGGCRYGVSAVGAQLLKDSGRWPRTACALARPVLRVVGGRAA